MRITLALVLVSWGVLGLIIFFLPGGLWTIFLGLTLLAQDVPVVKRLNVWLRARLENKFPRFYAKVVAPIDKVGERIMQKVRSLFRKKKEMEDKNEKDG
ncbi:MAG: hypothetical protein Q7S66_05635 [bacterium]|nr:hypothetical protein [bacterium]